MSREPSRATRLLQALKEAALPIRVGDFVRLQAGGDPMLVLRVEPGGDGTGGDGMGLLCMWVPEDETPPESWPWGWVSESSVQRVDDAHYLHSRVVPTDSDVEVIRRAWERLHRWLPGADTTAAQQAWEKLHGQAPD